MSHEDFHSIMSIDGSPAVRGLSNVSAICTEHSSLSLWVLGNVFVDSEEADPSLQELNEPSAERYRRRDICVVRQNTFR